MYDLFAWLFFATAGVSAWAAYNQVVALEKLALLAAGLIAVFVIDRLGRIDAARTLVWGGISCAVLTALLAALVLLPDKSVYRIRDDIIAAALIILLPLGGGALIWLWQHRFWFSTLAVAVAWALVVAVALTWAMAMLLWTGERSAWFTLMIATLCGWLVQRRFARSRRKQSIWLLDAFAISAVVAILAIYVLMIAVPDFHTRLPLGNRWTVVDHLEVWRDALVLIQDYPFTGSGLGATAMVYSTYVLLSHVPVLYHVHNLYLQIGVEQGLLGLVAFVGMVAAVFYALLGSWRKGARTEDGLRMATIIALATMLMHGLLDSELYASWLLPLLFLPFGFVLVAARLDQYVIDDARLGRQKIARSRGFVSGGIIAGVVGLAIIVTVALALALTSTVQAAFQANLGTVAQSQIELSVYFWPKWSVQDEVRRTDAVALGPAIAHYTAALQLDPQNVTALRRLGQIALAREEYSAARHFLEEAYAHAPQQRIIRLLLGEALTVSGDVEQGAAMWKAAAIDSDWLYQRYWWYRHIGAVLQASWLADAIALAESQRSTSQ